MIRRHKRGQSTLEYILLVTAVVSIIIGFVVSDQSPFRKQLNGMMQGSLNSMNAAGDKLSTSLQAAIDGINGG